MAGVREIGHRAYRTGTDIAQPGRSFCVLPFWAILLIASQNLYAQNEDETRERIMSTVREEGRVKDILLDFPEIRLQPAFSNQWGVWIVKFMHVDRGEMGLITVDPESMKVLEFSFNSGGRQSEEREEGRAESDEDRGEEGAFSLFRSLLPRFNGMTLAWVSLVLVVLLVGNFTRFLSSQNLDILLIYALAPFLHMGWTHTKASYTGIFVITLFLLIRCLWVAVRPDQGPLQVNMRHPRVLWTLIAFALMLHVLTLYERHIGDVGLWSAIGAEYLLRTGHLPYGTEFGANCVYGPLMYVLFVPAGHFASYIEEIPQAGNVILGEFNNWQAMRGVQTTELVLDLLTLYLLYRVARKLSDHVTGLTVVFIYAISPYVLGMVGELGLERASHLIGMPFILSALLLIHRPRLCRKTPSSAREQDFFSPGKDGEAGDVGSIVDAAGCSQAEKGPLEARPRFPTQPCMAGLLLGIATGMLYYPLFLVPLWCGYLWRVHGVPRAWVFLLSYAAVGMVCVVMLMFTVQPMDEAESPLGAFFDDTIAQQQFKAGYGNSHLSFWGQYPELATWGKPGAGVMYCLSCLLLAFFPRRMDFGRLIALSAAVLVGTQLVLSFAGGTYIGFYLAPVLLTLFAFKRRGEA